MDDPVKLFETFGLPGLCIFIILYLLEHHEIYDGIKALIIKPFIKGGKKFQQHYLASDIQSKLNKFSRHIIKDMDENDKFRAKIKWVENSTLDSFIEQDKIVIKMDCSDNANRNLTIATLAYVSVVVVKSVKPFMEETLKTATNMIITKKIMDDYADKHERDYFNNVYLYPALENDSELKNDCQKLSELDQKGYFTRLYLRELRYLGELLKETIPTQEVKEEIRKFLEYIHNVATVPMLHEGGERLEDSQFYFNGRYLKIRVLLLAVPFKIEQGNTKPYIKRIKEGIKHGSEIFYLLATENSFEFLKQVKDDLEHRLVRQKILKKTCDRTFYLRRSATLKEKHRCLIYRKIGSYDDELIDEIFEDIIENDTNNKKHQADIH